MHCALMFQVQIAVMAKMLGTRGGGGREQHNARKVSKMHSHKTDQAAVIKLDMYKKKLERQSR